MRLLNKAQSNKLLTLALAFVLALALFAGLKFSCLSVSAEEVEYTTYELGVLQFKQMEPDNKKMAYFGLSNGDDAPYSEPSEDVRWNSVFTLVAGSGVGVTINGETVNATIKVPGAVFVEIATEPEVDDVLVIEGTFYNEDLAVKYVIYKSKFVWNGSAWAKDYTTEVSNIYVKEIAKSYFFTFELTNNDYTESSGSGEFEKLEAYERYIAVQCSYWSNFSQMNSEGATLPQIYIYWNGGEAGNQVGIYPNAISHRVAGLDSLYGGFTIAIPAGTTFPSYTFVKGGCVGAPVFYTTQTSKAFYYDENEKGFTALPYEVATLRTQIDEEIKGIDLNLYEVVEQEQVKDLIKESRKNLKKCVSILEIEDTKDAFYSSLSKIMSKADYQLLAQEQTQAKADVLSFFDTLNESDYNETAWAQILSIKEQSNAEIDMIKRLGEVEYLVSAIKSSVGDVVTIAGWAEFEAYRQTAVSNLESSFDATLYLDAEKVQGEALVQEGKQKILDCVTYKDVDVIEADYISKVKALQVIQTEEKQDLGWIFAIIGGVVLLAGATAVVMLIINKNKKKEKKGE